MTTYDLGDGRTLVLDHVALVSIVEVDACSIGVTVTTTGGAVIGCGDWRSPHGETGMAAIRQQARHRAGEIATMVRSIGRT